METNLIYIKEICSSCMKSQHDKRASLIDIEKKLFLQFDSFSFLNNYFLDEKKKSLYSMIQFFTEILNLILVFNDDNQLDSFIRNHLFSFIFLNSANKYNQSDLFFILGTFFYQGKYAIKDYLKAKKCFKLSAKTDNNINAFLALGDLYFHGKIDKKQNNDRHSIAESYYRKYLEFYKGENDAHLYFDYFYEYENDIRIEYFIFKHFLIFSDELHNYHSFDLLEYLYSNIYGIKKDYFNDQKSNDNTNCLLNRLKKSSSFLFLGHILHYGKLNDPFYFGSKEYTSEIINFDFDNDDIDIEKYPENLNIKGYLNFNGILYEKNQDLGKKYYNLAIKQNNVNAMLNFGNIFYENDFYMSKYYFKKASKLNNSYAFLYLSNLHLKQVTNKNYHNKDPSYFFTKARKYAKISAEMNNPNALNLFANMNQHGTGGNRNFSIALRDYELAAEQNYAYSANNLGYLYRKGLGVEQNYSKSKKYYEIASNEFVSNAIFQVATYYSNGEGIEVDFQKAIELFILCIKVYYERILLIRTRKLFSLENTSVKLDTIVYLANNDLGVIHTIESKYFNINKAQNYFEETGFSEYIFGQSNCGVFYNYFCSNKKEKALYQFQKSAEKNFSLAEYNLGYLYEIDGEISKAINYYSNASNHDDFVIRLFGEIMIDNRLEISKTFICCLANLKLIRYYMSKSDFKLAKNFFIRMINQLEKEYIRYKSILEIDKNIDYKFQFGFCTDPNQNAFSYLNHFVINYPLFNLKNQKNLSNEIILKLNLNQENKLQFNLEKIVDNDNLIKLSSQLKKIQNCSKKDIELNEKLIDEKTEVNNVDLNDSIKNNPEYLFEFAILPDFQNDFVKEINEIHDLMMNIAHTYPYPILFGRIYINH